MNLKKFVYSSLGAAALVSGTQAHASLLNLNPPANAPIFLTSALTANYNSTTGVFHASVIASNGFDFFFPNNSQDGNFYNATLTFEAFINPSTPTSPVLTSGTFSLVANSVPLLSGDLKTGPLGGNWGAANVDSTPASNYDLFEFTGSITGGTFWDEFSSVNSLGVAGFIFDINQVASDNITDFSGSWNQSFQTVGATGTGGIFTDPSFVPEPSSALVGLLLTAGVLSNRRRSFTPRTATLSGHIG